MTGKSDLNKLPDSAIASLLDQGVKLGFFHTSPSSCDLKAERDDLETYRKIKKDGLMQHSFDINCQLIECCPADYCNHEGLINAIIDEINRVGGRTSKSHLCQTLHIKSVFLEAGSPILNELPLVVQVLGTDFISEYFWMKLREEVLREVEKSGVLDLVKLANQNAVTMDMLLEKIISSIEGVTWIEGSQELISKDYVEKVRSSIITHFQSLEEPVVVAKVCSEHSWDTRIALDWLIEQTRSGQIKGEVHMDTESMSLTTAKFTPFSYVNKQRDEITKFLEANGFISKERALRHGLSLFKVDELAKQYHEDVLILEDVLIIEHILLQKLQASIELCSETGISDLQEDIPAELIRQDIIFELLKRAKLSSNQCIPVISMGKAVLVAQHFQNEARNTVLLPLVESFAKTKAKEIIDESRKQETHEDEIEMSNHGGKKNKPRSRKIKDGHSNISVDGAGVVPLQHVAQRIMDQYARQLIVDADENDIASFGEGLAWEDEDDSGFLLIEFCKCVLYSDTFQLQCQSAVLAELKRLKSAKVSKASLSRKETATKIRNVESAFEDSFMDLCYLIQASIKFHLFTSGSKNVFDEATVKDLQNELLLGYCADLTSRITQYCLYKHEDDPLFTFNSRIEEEKAEDKTLDSSLPSFCMEINFTTTQPRRSYLSCPPPREPLPVLRECLDSNKGVTLARQWILCGGESYRGGVRISEEDGTSYVREGSMDSFLSHVQENCLTLCGLPFKKLDKKAEKQLLFRRKMALMTMLQDTTDPHNVLDLTIMLLFQQVKHLIAYGKHLRGIILNALVEERKIPASVKGILEGLNNRIEKGLFISEEHVDVAKGCGLCKDIGKHEIDFSIEYSS
ncbi:MAG: hypothetical protein SGBAC_004775 [Bacillariaceae sp.]